MQVTINRATPVPPPVESVVLELSDEEAAYIAVALGRLTPSQDRLGLYRRMCDAGLGHGTETYTAVSERIRRQF